MNKRKILWHPVEGKVTKDIAIRAARTVRRNSLLRKIICCLVFTITVLSILVLI